MWAVIGVPGLREIVLVVLVALALYGRSGSRLLMGTRYGRSLAPWISLVRTSVGRGSASQSTQQTAPSRLFAGHGRLFWFLVFFAVAAALAWIATRAAILSAPGTLHRP
jgi:hypothetical protein